MDEIIEIMETIAHGREVHGNIVIKWSLLGNRKEQDFRVNHTDVAATQKLFCTFQDSEFGTLRIEFHRSMRFTFLFCAHSSIDLTSTSVSDAKVMYLSNVDFVEAALVANSRQPVP